MATYSNANKASRPKVESPENFLEALRSLGKDTVSEVKNQFQKGVMDIPQSFGISSSGSLKPNEEMSVDSLKQAEQKGFSQAEADFSRRLNHMRQEERGRLVRQEAEAKQQIQAIQQEIRSLAKSMGEFAQEVEVAAMQAPVNPGIYHRNFYAHLKQLIKALKMRVDSSKEWLQTHNGRAKKQNFYWSQVKDSGSKFMLSSERYMVTSTG